MSNAPKKIESLTAEQEAALPGHRAKYMKIGWSTERSDRKRAEAGVTALYAMMNLPEPEFIWVDSPLAAAKLVKEQTNEPTSLTGTDGNLDAYWLSFYTFVAYKLNAEISEADLKQLRAWEDVIESTGPCYPHENVCVMTERPIIATYDDGELLHGEEAPALEYLDGFKIYAVNGIVVPEKVVMRPWEMTLEEIDGESNADIQTIMQALWCWEERDSAGDRKGAGGGRYLKESGCTVVHRDEYVADVVKGKPVTILRALLRDKHGRQYLMSGDGSTDRVYYIRVSPDAKTCPEAQEGLEGIPESKMVGRG